MKFFLIKILNKFKWFLSLMLDTYTSIDKKLFLNLDKIFVSKKFKNKNVILFDHFNSFNHQLIRLILLNSLSKKYMANMICFNYLTSPFLKKLYKIIKVEKFIQHNYVENLYYKNINIIFKKEINKIKTKNDLLNYKFKNLSIGLDIYETYLSRFRKITVDIKDKKLKQLIFVALKRVIFWENYFKNYNVKAVSISHRNYLDTNLVCRIAYRKKVPVFTFSGSGKRIGRFFGPELDSHKYLKNYFLSLSEKQKKFAIKISKKQLKKRFSGRIGVDMSYSEKSAFTKYDKTKRVIKQNNKIKVLICTHCFYDNPHAYGGNLFPDFYEWLKFIAELSHKTDYDWYIKPHPDYLPGTLENIKIVNKKFKNIKLIDPSTSFHRLAKEGINFALTVYGSVAHELPLLGINVINADKYNPHCSFNFSFTPKNKENYKKTILNLKNFKSKIRYKDEIYKFYYIYHYFLNKDKLIFNNKNKFEKLYLKDWKIFYEFFIKNLSRKKIKNLENVFFEFFDSNFKYLLEKNKQLIINRYEKY